MMMMMRMMMACDSAAVSFVSFRRMYQMHVFVVA